MMSAEQNRLITQTGKETPAGELLRRYWQPIALADELKGPRPIRAIRVLGQDVVLFRDEAGRLGVIDRDCPHRGADMAFGRLEDGGLRCLFHGWLFDVEGKCLETPAEPPGSRLCANIRQKSYPVCERSGIIFAYLGDREPPAFPALDCFEAPETFVFAFKGFLDCNWLQAVEVGFDPAHASFLHRYFEDEDPSGTYGRQFRGASAGSDMPMTEVLRQFPRPDIDVYPSDIGLQILATRDLGDGRIHVRATNAFFPQAFVIPLSAEMTITQWHVPVDDVSCYWYAVFTSFTGPVDKQEMRDQRLKLYQLPDYKPRLGRFNDYGYNHEEQRMKTYTGMGDDINVHDQWAVESQGPIQDRTREHLGQTDKAIIHFRRLLLAEIKKASGKDRVFLECMPDDAQSITGPSTIDSICSSADWQEKWRQMDRARRSGAPWSSLTKLDIATGAE
jgi:phenylpropionate dioxygenase-like ring-hydroxylating dioxygenase large terminal subunit